MDRGEVSEFSPYLGMTPRRETLDADLGHFYLARSRHFYLALTFLLRIMCRRYVRRSPTEGRVTSPENAPSSGLVIYT